MPNLQIIGSASAPLGEAALLFPQATQLAKTVAVDSDFQALLNNLGPVMVRNGADIGPTDNWAKDTSALYSTSGSINTNTYNAIVQSLTNYITGKGAVISPNFRLMLLDNSKNVGFDSAKSTLSNSSVLTSITGAGSNVSGKAFNKIYDREFSYDSATNTFSNTSKIINENHVGRVEMTSAELSPSGVAVNERYSGTLKRLEARAVFAIKADNKVVGLMSPSVPLA